MAAIRAVPRCFESLEEAMNSHQFTAVVIFIFLAPHISKPVAVLIGLGIAILHQMGVL